MNRELPDIQAGIRKGRETRDKIANIHCIIEKGREFQKSIYFCFIDYTKAFDCVDHNELWKILRRDENTRLPYLPPEKSVCRLRSNNESVMESVMEHWTGRKLGKEHIEAVYCHPAYLTSRQSISCEMLGWMKQKIEGRNINNLRYTNDITLTAESEEKLKSCLVKMKEESEKAGLKLNIQKPKIMASHQFMGNRRGNNGNSDGLCFLGLQSHCGR